MSQAILGAAVALVYAGVVMAIGSGFLTLLMSGLSTTVRGRVGSLGFLWLGFVMGQGILGVVWLALSLAGILYPALIGIVCISVALLACARLLSQGKLDARLPNLTWSDLSTFLRSHSWYFWVGTGILTVALLHGVIALLPPWIDDGLKHYMVWAKMIAATHTLNLQPSLHPFYGLLPMQVEMHWAALFSISNETAVTVWDYFCALSFLTGIGLLAWTLTSSHRVALLAVLIMLSTPAFYAMMGGGKIDNASAQYGIAASLWLVLWPALGRRAAIFAGLCIGWAMASRYTNVIVIPGLILFAIIVARNSWREFPVDIATKQSKSYWVLEAFVAGIAAAVAGVPMLLKNWLLVGCPLAPEVGCQGTFWASIYRIYTSHFQNLSVTDLFWYPFVWTFAGRDSMLGNISPLFIGFCPFLLVYRRSSIAQSALVAGLAGFASIMTWLLIEPLVLFTRFLLVPLGLLAIPLSASVIAAEQDRSQHSMVRFLIRSAIALVFVFLLFETRGVIYAGRYVASIDTRADWYQSRQGYDVASWLNDHVQPGERVALGNFKGHRYFVDPNVLLHAESAEEFQWLWEHGDWRYGDSGSITPTSWISDFWHFYADRRFTYVVVAKDRVGEALAAWPSNLEGRGLHVVVAGQANDVLKIAKH